MLAGGGGEGLTSFADTEGERVESFKSFDGTTIAFREWGSEYGGIPVLLQHGFAADSISNWVTPGVADRIVAEGRHVVAIELAATASPPSRTTSPPKAIDRSGIVDALRAPRAEDVQDRMSRWFRRFADSTGADLEALAAAIPGAKYVVVPGDHLSAVGVPEFADAIVGFLQSLPKRS